MSPMICKVLYFFLVVMPDFLHQRYVGMYTHLQGGRLKVLELSRSLVLCFFKKREWPNSGSITLQGTNISHLGEGKSSSKVPLEWDMLVPWRVNYLFGREIKQCKGTINFRDFPLRVHLARVGVVQWPLNPGIFRSLVGWSPWLIIFI